MKRILLTIVAICAVSAIVLATRMAPDQNSAQSRGAAAIERYGCGTCHVVPGVPTAIGLVGPPLTDFTRRTYIAGELPNTPDNLRLWIMHPREVEPHTAMPDTGVTAADAADITSFLLRDSR